MADKIFPKGVMVFAPNSSAPDWVIGNLVITPRELVDWLSTDGKQYLKDGKNSTKQLKLNIKRAESGKYYTEVDTYDPNAPKPEAKPQTNNDMPKDDLPF